MYLELSLLVFFIVISITISSFILNKLNKNNFNRNNEGSKLLLEKMFNEQHINQINMNNKVSTELEQHFRKIQGQVLTHMREQANENHKQQVNNLKYLSETISTSLKDYSEEMRNNFRELTKTADTKLQQIGGLVEKRLSEGLEKTNNTFTDIVKRLALIDDAQQKLNSLSTNIISLQDILADKRSRGAFGEIQLKNLIENMLPKENYNFQFTLNNNFRVDCMLFLPPPTGNIAIDAKFPLENYYLLTSSEASTIEKNKAQQSFKIDIKKHINDIADKYIVKGETSEFAIMFIPAEAVFSEIHRNFAELVDYAYKKKVFITSPTTIMAILTTASAVIKDSETRKHIHLIKEHLNMLAKDFSRFENRMEKLTTHIDQAKDDVTLVNTSAKKITARFKKIEQAKIANENEEIAKIPES